MVFNEYELTLWDLVPVEDRVCAMGSVHLLNRLKPSDQIYVRSVCSNPWCPGCEPVRVWRIRHRITKYFQYYNPPRQWLLTRSVRNEFRLIDAFATLRETNRGFRDKCNKYREGNPFDVVSHWMGTYEITFSLKKGYNLHQHLILSTQGENIDYGLVHTLWDRAAGYRAHTNFIKLNDVPHAINYISKYIAKGTWGGLSRGRAWLNRGTLKGRNRVITKHGTALGARSPMYYLCCIAPDKHCVSSTGGWDLPRALTPKKG